MTVLLDGFSIGGYRSFGAEPQFIGPLSKINLFAGPNNCGKSNILRFVTFHLNALVSHGGQTKFSSLDTPLNGPKRFCAGIAVSREEINRKCQKFELSEPHTERLVNALFNCEILTRNANPSSNIWFTRESEKLTEQSRATIDYQAVARQCPTMENWWEHCWSVVCKKRGGSLRDWVPELLHSLSPLGSVSLNVAMIDAIRQVMGGNPEKTDHSGRGLIKRLAELQHPTYDKQDDKKKFAAIEHFLQDVTENSTARLEIPHQHDSITVLMDGKSLPIESLGTGIHEVIILAAASTVLSDHVICMEEPEIHLHPIYQRKLIRYLSTTTNNQYLIGTHSAHLLDSPEATVFHVTMSNNETNVRKIASAGERWNLSRELGARASDIVQSNSAIWVEGPSDRIYLNHWIKAIDPTLVETVHYSVLFYGGKVLANFNAEHDPLANDLVSMAAANRHSAIVMDRDRANATDEVNPTKVRVRGEILKAGGQCWVTCGREVENYIPGELISAAIKVVNSKAKLPTAYGQFDDLVPEGVSKPDIAREVVKSVADLSPFNLRDRIIELVQFIRRANHLPNLEVK